MVKVKESLVGQRFDSYTVIKQVEDYVQPNGQHFAQYLCRCDCGNEKIITAHNLKIGHGKSCGCLRREDLTGLKFNKLLALEQTEDHITLGGHHFAQYRCLCDCGNETIVKASSLKNGHTKSCGKCPINTYKDMGDYYIGYTSKGEEFYFDKDDYDLVKDYTWRIESSGYVVTDVRKEDGSRGNIRMHRLVMGIADEQLDWNRVIDHKKHGKKYRCDNRKENLWICTQEDNMRNISMNKNNTSGFTGVDKPNQKWRARINVNGKTINLGLFTNIEDAIEARRNAEMKYWNKE